MASLFAFLLLISPVWISSVGAQKVPTFEIPRAVAKDDLARDAFRNGIEAFQKGDFAASAESFRTIPELGGFLSLYTHWFLGQSLYRQKKWQEAIPHFEHVFEAKSASELKYQAQFFLGQIAMEQEKWSEAERVLGKLERKWRKSLNYPDVLFELVKTELKLKRPPEACKWARKLYVKFPAHPKVIAWGHSLSDQSVAGMNLSCSPNHKEFQERVRKLQLSGESEKARGELLQLQAQTPAHLKVSVDLIMANFLVNEGLVDDALGLLVRYYPTLKGNFGYLMLLGKAAARAGEYQTSVGAFELAYKMSPRSKKGREALFQAAYLSYQFQDYDGAVRKFNQFIKQQPRSGLAQDAQWHLAWLKYLRGDYKVAVERFDLLKRSVNRRRASAESLLQRISYWSAMARLREKKLAEAKAEFAVIFQKNPNSYYGLAAQARLENLKDVALDGSRIPTAQVEGVQVAAQVPPAEEDESEESLSEPMEPSEEVEVSEEEGIQPSDFKDPMLRSRIEVAQKLIEFGMPELARWELWEVERRTRNSQYLKMLISAYEGIGSYNRSSSISELNFSRERESLGLEGARALWTAMYPQAYRSIVQRSARQFQASPEWLWAIMRTESQYKPDVISPVGARGLMQLMPFTARNLSRLGGGTHFLDSADLFRPELNLALGAQYLNRLSLKFKGSLPLVSAAYNAGPHRVENWLMGFGQLDADEFIEHIPFLETRNYVKKVLRTHTLYRRIYSKDQKPVELLAKNLGVPIPKRPSTKESWEAL